MQLDWSFLDTVNWPEVAWFSAIAFLATLIGSVLRHRFWAAILAAILFAVAYIFLVYFPHGLPVPGINTVAPTR
jgi:predicted acyltransferase